jgi:hypothetical protein
MADYYWTLHDAQGNDLRDTERFPTKEEAESFMGAQWRALLDEGGETASLKEDGDVLYRMGLREA